MSKKNKVQKVKVKRIPGTNTLVKVECYVDVNYDNIKKDFTVFMAANKAYVWEQIKKGNFGFKIRKTDFNRKV